MFPDCEEFSWAGLAGFGLFFVFLGVDPWEDTSTVNSQPNMMVLNPESQDEATTKSVTATTNNYQSKH
jgi:hypothetical protein